MKNCRKCGAADRYPSGACKPCAADYTRQYRIKNAEKEKENRDRWRKENKEKLNAQNRAWISETQGRVVLPRAPKKVKPTKAPRAAKENLASKKRNVKAEWHCKKCGSKSKHKSGNCRDCTNERNRIARTVNADRTKANRDAWRAKKSDVLNAQNHKRRKAVRERGILSDNITAIRFKEQGGLCNCCYKPLGNKYDLDHIMPLSLGGVNEDDNVQLLSASCNRSKGAKNPLVFAISRALIF